MAYAPQTVHTRTHVHLHARYTNTNVIHVTQAEQRIAVRSFVWGRGSRHGAELRSLSSSLPHRFFGSPPYQPFSFVALDFGIPPSRRLGIFRFFPRRNVGNRPARRRAASSAFLTIRILAARCRHVPCASGIDFRCAARRVILIRSCQEWETRTVARIYRSERLLTSFVN